MQAAEGVLSAWRCKRLTGKHREVGEIHFQYEYVAMGQNPVPTYPKIEPLVLTYSDMPGKWPKTATRSLNQLVALPSESGWRCVFGECPVLGWLGLKANQNEWETVMFQRVKMLTYPSCYRCRHCVCLHPVHTGLA